MAKKRHPHKKGKNTIIGIIANTTKENVFDVISLLIDKLKSSGFDYILSDSIRGRKESLVPKVAAKKFLEENKLCSKCDIVISIGGDGTMLNTAYKAQFYNKPVLGINFGKLGFLAEVNVNQLDKLIEDIEKGDYEIEERMIISGECVGHKIETLYGINDIVIDKGGWPKMIELTIAVNNEYVTTFAADGLIVSTPTGSTGYAVSTGGPIVSPQTDVITLCPISPHGLTMRSLVLPGNSEIVITASSNHNKVLANCDGQRVFSFKPPLRIKIKKSERPFRLLHTPLTNYYETLRNKLLWGIDIRRNISGKEDLYEQI
ncbi:MAG: NAD(+)/NADH kinase [Ignavibacteriaceae bacterium]